MKKITQLSRLKIPWPRSKTSIIMLLGFVFQLFQVQAQTYSYTGAVQTVTLPAGTYEIQTWGADGGNALNGTGGKGGYASGTITVTTPTTYYLYVGGKGSTGSVATTGGWNGGGGLVGTFSSPNEGASGGGGTDVRTTSNTTYANRIIVAGGGGGAVGYGSYTGNGGNGGGAIGESGGSSRGTSYIGGGGTQTAGGAPSSTTYSSAGDVGIGGDYIGTLGGSAGGGGYYGGGGGHWGGAGGGGSSYVGGVSNGVTIMFGQPGYVPNPDVTGNGTVVITNMAPCTGTPSSGVAAVTARTCINDPFTLFATGATKAGGITYQWQSAPSATGPWTDIAGANNSTLTISNQTVTTNYRLVVTCTNGGATATTNVVNVSQAAIANLSENFDTTATGSTTNASIPSCWSYIDEITTTGYGYVEAATALSGSNSFRLYRTNTTSNAAQNLVLISPQTDNLGNGTKQLRFYAMATNTNATNILQIVRSDGTSASSTFTIIQSIVVNHTGYQEYIVPIPATTDDYFGFRLAHNGATAAVDINIDDVYYEDFDTCLYPTGVTVSNITQTSADISWTGSTSSSVTAYQYEVRSSGVPGSGAAGLGATGTTPNATTTSVTATGLNPSLNYTVYVRSICGTANGKWTPIPTTFFTLCGIVNTMFSESFDTTPTGSTTNPSIPNCWSYFDDVATTGYGYVEAATAQSAPNSFRLYRTNSTTNAPENVVLISPETVNLGNGTRQLRFSAMASNTNTTNILQLVRSNGTTASSTYTVLQDVVVNHTGYQEYIVPLPVTTDDYFGFRLAHNNSTVTVDINIDDVYYENLSPCIYPMNFQVNSVAATTATLSWDASLATGVTGYEYEVRTSGAPGSGTVGLEQTGVTAGTVTSVNITGLTSATNYIVYVRSICGASPGMWTTFPREFQTLCDIYVNDFYENFDTTLVGSTTTPSIPVCWSFIDDVGSTGYLYTHNLASSAPQSGTNYLRMYRTNSTTNAAEELVMISPETNNLGNGAKQLRFSVKTYGTSATAYVNKLEVLSMPSNTSTSGATVLATFTPNQVAYEEYIVPLPAGTNDYFGFRLAYNGGTTGSSVSIDDVYYEDIPAPTLATTQSNNICPGDTNGMASVVVTGGAAPITYLWNTGDTTPTLTGLAAGTYTVTVTDGISRTATETVTITEPDALVSNAVVNNISCNGSNNGTIDITPTGGTAPYTYLWTTGDTGTSVSNLAPGTYSLTITDANNCTATEDFVITEPTVLVATNAAQTDVSMFGGNDGAATVAASGGTAPYTYMWSNGATTAAITNLTAGTYTATVTDANGCTATEDFVITQPIPLMVQSVSQTNVSCNGGSDASASIVAIGGNAPYTYQWSPSGGTAATATGLSAGMYSVLVTDHTGNTITENFTITEPAPIVGTVSKTDITCNGANDGTATVSVAGGTAPYTYLWSNGMMSNMATNLNVGNYTVSITDANGCKTTASVSIAQPTALAITGTATNISCFGQNDGAITVSASGGTAPYSYSWSNGQSGTSLSSLAKGTYTVTITDANGCSKTETYTIVEPAFVHPPVAVNQSFCIGQNATLADVVITGSTIKWYSASTGGVLLPATTVLTNGTTYYASQTVGTCESSTRTAVQITLNQGTPLTTTQLNVCSNTRVQNMTIDGFNYTQLKWYSSPTSAIQLPASQLLATGTYYISSLTGTCESPRQAVQVTVAAAVPAPTATAQTVCGNSTLNDLVVGKDPSASLNWYSSLQSMIPLSGTTQVSNGTYYVQQVIGNCESVRVAVPVQVVNVTAPTMTSITACNGTQIGDLNTPTTTYVWYVSNTATTPLPNSFVLTSGSYYIAQENAGCISTRTNVAVNVSPVPNSPTGQTTQTFPYPAKVSDLVMNQPNVKWYASANDAMEMINELAPSTFLMSNTTYYGIIVNPNNCGSAPTAVTVILSVSTQELDLTQLKYYPNPVDSALHISYNEAITKVEVFTLTGQKVMSNEFNAIEVTTDLSRLSSGTYLVKVETAKASQFIKVVKR
ncbi:glycine-rich protein [Flavobacterium sp. CBA20B-1]|uniref:glycine-rich protein n=1 Tax=unclassified Flavobacterium TaxID=196869 RepID=UPI0022241D3D|nr:MULTISPECIES: glycine-rich protein [unclassified Flavobacterium]WCM41012.1 glycine-rich protein [Flavobacterium sp. CBA20B-1]